MERSSPSIKEGEWVMAVIKRMWEETFVYDRMYIMNAKMTRKVFLDSDEITL